MCTFHQCAYQPSANARNKEEEVLHFLVTFFCYLLSSKKLLGMTFLYLFLGLEKSIIICTPTICII